MTSNQPSKKKVPQASGLGSPSLHLPFAERHRPLQILGDGSWAHSKYEAARWMLSSAWVGKCMVP